MVTRVVAGSVLLVAALIAWIAVTSLLAARILQVVVIGSVVYVAVLALRGWQAMVDAHVGADGARVTASAGPFVSALVAARDEAAVIAGIMDDLARQRYGGPDGAPRFEVVLVDGGSTDGTGRIAVAAAEAAGAPVGLVRVVRHDQGARPSTKGAALAGVGGLRGAVVVVLDADTRIDEAFLVAGLQAWERDPDAAAVQVRRTPLNERASWLTGAQADEQLMDLASQCGRRRMGGTAELRGNGMFVRRAVLDRLGGWSGTALTEDLELSTRLAAAGEHVALAPEVQVREEAVESLAALWTQRLRWAEGSIRRLIEGGRALLEGPASVGAKLDFLAFTGEFLIAPLFVASFVASVVTLPLSGRTEWTVPITLFVSYGLGSFVLAAAGLAATGERGWRLVGRATRGSLFLAHWLVVVPVVLVRIAVGSPTRSFAKTPRVGSGA